MPQVALRVVLRVAEGPPAAVRAVVPVPVVPQVALRVAVQVVPFGKAA